MAENNLSIVTKALFYKKGDWYTITDQMKEETFFIINRFLSKTYPKQSFFLNNKKIDKIAALDTWYYFLLKKPFPKDFWSKSTDKKVSKLTKKDLKFLSMKLSLNEKDVLFLERFFFNQLIDELNYFKEVEKLIK